ncbi:MAG TPA: hypothetical protein VFL12_10380 [Thermoanaerobaculia bacterium]|nr:hypothetical protein [Thermoanaerobaculia bacterium]
MTIPDATPPDASGEIACGLLLESEFGAMAALLAETFHRSEPPAVAAGLSAAD